MFGMFCREDCPCEPPPPPPPCDVVLHLITRGCKGVGHPVEGVDFRVTETGDATVIDSGTTDGSGQLALTVPAPSFPYLITVAWDAYCGYAAGSADYVLSACVDRFLVVQLEADDDHVCCAICEFPISKTLPFNCENGSCDLEYSEVYGLWKGSFTFTGKVSTTDETYINCVCPPAPGRPGHTIYVLDVTITTASLTVYVFFNCGSLWVAWQDIPFPPLLWAYRFQFGCDGCDWAYENPGGGFFLLPSGGLVVPSSCDCDTFTASGTIPGADICITLNTCDNETAPVPEECCVTVPSPVGSWALG